MTRLSWSALSERYFEGGVDRGVLYIGVDAGVSWPGLISVSESPRGGEARPYYLDGVKYLNLASKEEFEATINAFSAPKEFAPCDGVSSIQNGLFATQQPRKAFSFSYRTRVGNDTEGKEHGYKIHLVYNALAGPSERNNSTLGDSVEPNTYTWQITTLPPSLTGRKPTAHFVIDSRYTPRVLLSTIEDILYGSDAAEARLPMVSELITMFQSEGPLTRRNWLTNPAFRGTSAMVEIWRNYIQNPRMEAVSGTAEARRNECTNPMPASGTGWAGPGIAVTGIPAPWNASRTAAKTTATGAGTHYIFTQPSARAWAIGDVVTVSATVQGPAGKWCEPFVHNRTSNAYYGTGGSGRIPSVQLTGAPQRISATFTMTEAVAANTLDMAILFYENTGRTVLSADTVVYAGDVLIEATPMNLPYFDGGSAASGDFTCGWVSTANASASTMFGSMVANVSFGGNNANVRSTAWTRPGRQYSMRMVSKYKAAGSGYTELATLVAGAVILVPGKTYTLGGWFYSDSSNPNNAAAMMFVVSGAGGMVTKYVAAGGGEQYLKMTFTVPTDPAMTGAYLRLYNGLAANVADVWVSDLILVEGKILPEFFDGASLPNDGLVYSWSGAVKASASVAKANNVSGASLTVSGGLGTFWLGGDGNLVLLVKQAGAYDLIQISSAYLTKDTPSARVKTTVVSDFDVLINTWISFDASVPARVMKQFQLTAGVPLDIDEVYVNNGLGTLTNIGSFAIGFHPPGQTYVEGMVRISPILLAEGDDVGPYFDGSTQDADNNFYSWEGPPDASTSVLHTWN